MDHLGALRMFVRVVETRSFSAVARELGVAQSAVSRNVATLERELGATLLARTTRAVSPTESGRALYERVAAALREIDDVEAAVRRGVDALAGPIRVAVPGAIGRKLILPVVTRFMDANPAVRVELDVTDRVLNLVEMGADFAVRVGRPAEGSFAVRTLARSPQVFVAAPAYLARRPAPQTLQDLAAQDLVLRRDAASQSAFAAASPALARATPRVLTDDVETAWSCVRAGLGVGMLPHWLVAEDILSGALLRVHLDAPLPVGELVLLYPAEVKPTARARALIEAIAAELKTRFAALP
jgi:DNA-binding transcriptional LysR family regulator